MRNLRFITKIFIAAAFCFAVSCDLYERPKTGIESQIVRVDPNPGANILDGAVENFDAGTDYFPEKATFTRARQLAVEYGRHYKRVTFRSNLAGETVRYVLVQRGTPVPDLPELADDKTRLVFVPVNRFAQRSFRYGGAVDLLGVVPRLVAFPRSDIITTPSIRRRIESGEVRHDAGVELLVEADTEAVFEFYNGGVQDYLQRQYHELDLQIIQMAEHLESEPLAKTEWIKFLAMFFNREKTANEYYARVESEYENLKNRVAEKLPENSPRPRVMVNHYGGGAWFVYGERNTQTRLIQDAGGDYSWRGAETSYAGIFRTAYEAGYDRLADADVWIVGADWSTRFAKGDPLFDERIRKLPIARSGRFFVTYNPDENGRNPYWDQALINPHLELADYVKAIHPDILPEHEFVYLRNLTAKN
jgi:iron complex transport system substrate-binding protein